MILEIVKESFNAFVARNGYEELCRQYLLSRGDSGNLPFRPLYAGRIWNRNVEIDIAAIDKKSRCVLLGECKWHTGKVGESVLIELKEKSKKLRSITGYSVLYTLFSRSGFTKGLQSVARKENVLLFEGAECREL